MRDEGVERELRLPALGARKEAICALTPRCDVVAEIGADHGITSAHLLRQGICRRIVVTDISAASLDKAKRLFALHRLADAAEFCVADGIDALQASVDAIIIAGMGAGTIVEILRAGLDKVGQATLVLQANTDVEMLRGWLVSHGFVIMDEALALDRGRFYVVLSAQMGQVAYTDKELYLGPCLLHKKGELYVRYLCWRRKCLQRMRREDVRQPLRWIEEELLCHKDVQ